MKRKWKRTYDLVGYRGRTEPAHLTGSFSSYGTGAVVQPIDDWQRKHLYINALSDTPYRCDAHFKFGHLTLDAKFSCYAKTIDEGKRRCEQWLKKKEHPRSTPSRRR